MTEYNRAVVEIQDFKTGRTTKHVVCSDTLSNAMELAWRIESLLKHHIRSNCTTVAAWEVDG
jgi:hypothetical protein